MKKVRLCIASDRPAVCQALARRLESLPCIELIDTGGRAEEVLAITQRGGCDVVLQVREPESGLDQSALFLRLVDATTAPPAALVVQADLTRRADVLTLLSSGVKNIVSALDDADAVAQAVLMAHMGIGSLSPRAMDVMWGSWRAAPRAADEVRHSVDEIRHSLSRRELEVLRLYLAGVPISKIARDTGRSVNTVSAQKKSLMRKMNVQDHVQLVAMSMQYGLV
ncbi:helix-turn-helix transcriptional regulator [Cupriavidus metallidurans]|uniref:helix-turn-helix transcriptional regulator n=1 Tax=Cupriavidus metallidurans TaxID=119219 RepID=UPI001CCD8DA6|nr:response regulator transcription factor [Cupriavidus metallidurans]UBM08293.1 response regulator transcription factor [Cupriavidus metallidurans]